MTTNTFAAGAAPTQPVDTLTLALAARRSRDAYVANALANGVKSLAGALTGWMRRRRAFAELEQLDSRLMADIGLDRAAFAAGVIRRIDADRAQAFATSTLAPVTHPVTRHAAEPHLAPAIAPAAANDSRRAA